MGRVVGFFLGDLKYGKEAGEENTNRLMLASACHNSGAASPLGSSSVITVYAPKVNYGLTTFEAPPLAETEMATRSLKLVVRTSRTGLYTTNTSISRRWF